MAVNWKKGFRRIALIGAVLAAIAGGVVGFKIATEQLQTERRKLEREERLCYGWLNPSYLLDKWEKCTSFEDQKSVWKRWTGEDLEESFKRSALAEEIFLEETRNKPVKITDEYIDELERRYGRSPETIELRRRYGTANKIPEWMKKAIPVEEPEWKKAPIIRLSELDEPKYTWMMSQESRESLTKQGWQTVDGKVLPYTLVEVFWLYNSLLQRDSLTLKEARRRVREGELLYRPLGVVIGGAVGFGGVWLVYLFLEWAISWLARGFHDTDTEQKSGGQTNK